MLHILKRLLNKSTRSLLIAAISLHLVISIGTYFLAKTQVSPAIQSDGVLLSVTPDAIDNICFAEQLADYIRAGDIRSWTVIALPLYSKIYSLSFVVFSPLLGMSVLAGEPINLIFYLAILILVFRIGTTVFNRDVGLVSSIIVGIWPSFLLHSTQLIKDQFFITGLLMIILIMITWLTKSKPTLVSTVLMGIAGAAGAYLIVRTRTPYWALLILVLTLIGFLLLLIRQLTERQLLLRYMLTAVPIIVVLIATYSTAPRASMQVAPSPLNPPTAPQSSSELNESAARMTLKRRLDLIAVRMWQLRWDYERAEGGAGLIDQGIVFGDAQQLLLYTPRALLIGLFAPFPNQWFEEGRQSGKMGRRVAAAEMLVTYAFIAFAVIALWRRRKSTAVWLLAFITVIGVTTLALIVPNLGAMFRMRYGFLILLVPLAVSELLRLLNLHKDRVTSQPTNANR